MEKTDKSAAQDIAAKEWNDSFDYRSLRNGVQVGNIKMIHLDSVNKRAMDIYAAQQLSEYKEVIKELLPLVIAYSMHLEGLGNYESLNERITSSIDRAKKLIDK